MYFSTLRQYRWPGAFFSLLLAVLLVVSGPQKVGAQTTATLSGTILDSAGSQGQATDVRVLRACHRPWRCGPSGGEGFELGFPGRVLDRADVRRGVRRGVDVGQSSLTARACQRPIK